MSSSVKNVVAKAAPWRSGQPWWVVVIEGVVALVLGVWIWAQTQNAAVLSGQVTALFLLVVGGLGLWTHLRAPSATRIAQVSLIRAVVGVVTGGLIFLLLWLNVLTLGAGLAILALGMLLFGALGVYIAIADDEPGTRWGALITSAVFAVIGVLLLVQPSGELLRTSISLPLVIGGIALLGLAAWNYSRAHARGAS